MYLAPHAISVQSRLVLCARHPLLLTTTCLVGVMAARTAVYRGVYSQVQPKVLLGFSIANFSPEFGSWWHDKSVALRLMCGIAIPSDYESTRTETAPVSVYTLV